MIKFRKIALTWGMAFLTLTFAFAQAADNGTVDPSTIKGSMYTTDQYAEGVISYADKSLTVPLRYNAFQDLMEYQQGGKTLVLDAGKTITRVQIGDERWVPLPYDNKGKQKYGYFVVLDSGEMTLLCKRSVVYQAPLKGRGLDGGDLPAQYKRVPDTYYYRLSDGTTREIDNLKTLLTDLPGHRDAMAAYVKKEKPSVKKERDLVALSKQYNALRIPE